MRVAVCKSATHWLLTYIPPLDDCIVKDFNDGGLDGTAMALTHHRWMWVQTSSQALTTSKIVIRTMRHWYLRCFFSCFLCHCPQLSALQKTWTWALRQRPDLLLTWPLSASRAWDCNLTPWLCGNLCKCVCCEHTKRHKNVPPAGRWHFGGSEKKLRQQ